MEEEGLGRRPRVERGLAAPPEKEMDSEKEVRREGRTVEEEVERPRPRKDRQVPAAPTDKHARGSRPVGG